MSITIERTPLKSTDDQQHDKPPLFAIVVHANTQAFGLSLAIIVAHVIVAHVGLSAAKSAHFTRIAMQQGRCVIKSGLTKEVADTIMSEINDCDLTRDSKNFSFKMEQA